jgi:hypothetical protein
MLVGLQARHATTELEHFSTVSVLQQKDRGVLREVFTSNDPVVRREHSDMSCIVHSRPNSAQSTRTKILLLRQETTMSHKSPFTRMASVIAAAFATAATAQNAPAQGASELEEVVVTGSRLQASGFNTPTPVTMIDAQAIAQRAPANIADVIYEAPSFFVVTRSDTTRQNLTRRIP